MQAKFNYGNWIRKKILVWLGLSATIMAVLALLPLHTVFRAIAAFFALLLFISFFIPLYSYIAFSPYGGNLQEKVYNLIIQNLHPRPKANALDIGAGNGILTVKLAQSFPGVSITGMDYWGIDWEYSKGICEENAALANAADRVCFVKGDAASLDFPDASFDSVVSNLTFHEVKSVQQKNLVVKEALRVLKPGGSFSFVDYFYESRHYGSLPAFQEFLQQMDLGEATLKPISELIPVPRLLLHPKIFGRVGILYGRK